MRVLPANASNKIAQSIALHLSTEIFAPIRAFLDRVDDWPLRALRDATNPGDPLGPSWVESAMIAVTTLGDRGVLALIVVVAAIHLMSRRRIDAALFLAGAYLGADLLTWCLKLVVNRPRPQIVPWLITQVSSASFPSGHALQSMVVYLALGMILVEVLPSPARWKSILAAALIVSLAIGVSRVYLGVHYPTDVLAGWLLGVAWLGIIRQFWLRAQTVRPA